jgi:hypothetical protein
MASSAPTPALRQLFDRILQVSTEVEALFEETRDRSRRDLAEQINQAARRMRQAVDSEELASTLVDAAGVFAAAAAFLRVDGANARGERIRGVPPEAADRFAGLEIPLSAAAALAGAVETRDPVTAIAAEAEVSPQLAGVFAHPADARVTVFPIQVRDVVRAVVYTSGDVMLPAVEMLCQIAAAVWGSMEPVVVNAPAPAPELVQIAPPAPPPERPRPTWESLPAGEQQVHLKAQRFARVQVSQIRLHDAPSVQSGRARRDLYGALRQRIDDTRTVFHEQFFASCPSMVDYLHLELVRTLAQDDADLLGKDYPGPLV